MKMCKYKKNSNSIKENILSAWNGANRYYLQSTYK